MDRILIIMNSKWPQGFICPFSGAISITFKHVYWYIQQISGERLQDHWSSSLMFTIHGHGGHPGHVT